MEVFPEEKKSGGRFAEEFKVEAFKQDTERGHPVAKVAARLVSIRTACTAESSAIQ